MSRLEQELETTRAALTLERDCHQATHNALREAQQAAEAQRVRADAWRDLRNAERDAVEAAQSGDTAMQWVAEEDAEAARERLRAMGEGL